MPHNPDQIGETQLVRQLRHDVAGLQAMVTCAKWLTRLGLPFALPEDLQVQAEALAKQLDDIVTTTREFNHRFRPMGWVASESINFNLMKEALSLKDDQEAEKRLVQSFTDDDIRFGITRIKGLPNGTLRWGLLDKLREDHLAGRYHAVVPNLLAQADGLVNDVEPTGLFAEGTEIVAPDSIAGHPDALGYLVKLLSQSRKKTQDVQLTVPFRHGIVHGRDLGFDNEVVAAKCWSILFAAADMLRAKLNPTAPRSSPPIRETLRKMAEAREFKEVLAKWQSARRTYTPEAPEASDPEKHDSSLPDNVVLRCLSALRRQNYGDVAKLTYDLSGDSPQTRAGRIRARLEFIDLGDYRLVEVDHYAYAMAKAIVRCEREVAGRALHGQVELTVMLQQEDGQLPASVGTPTLWRVLEWSLSGLAFDGPKKS